MLAEAEKAGVTVETVQLDVTDAEGSRRIIDIMTRRMVRSSKTYLDSHVHRHRLGTLGR